MATVIEVDWFNTYLLKKLIPPNLNDSLAGGNNFIERGGFMTPQNGFPLTPGLAYPGGLGVLELNTRENALESSAVAGAFTPQSAVDIYVSSQPVDFALSTTNGKGALFNVLIDVDTDEVAEIQCINNGSGYEVGDVLVLSITKPAPNATSGTVTITLQQDDFFNYAWYAEESRIRGGFNNTSTDKGVKAYVNEPNPQQQARFNSLIYSGVYNSRTGKNETNVFSVADDLVRSADPQNGSIQITHAEDTNLIVFQENKVSRALIDKDTIYTTEGGTQTQAGSKVLGQIVPYKGEYGISRNPESFAVYGYRKYFVDKDRSSVLRLSGDGLTEISSYGMTDYFRDQLTLVSDDNTNYIVNAVSNSATTAGNLLIKLLSTSIASEGFEETYITAGMVVSFLTPSGRQNLDGYVSKVEAGATTTKVYLTQNMQTSIDTASEFRFTHPIKPQVVGGWDIHNKNYVLSLQITPTQVDPFLRDSYKTLTFDEAINGWVSFTTYKPELMGSLKNNFYTFHKTSLYEHYDETTSDNRGFYYDKYEPSTVTFVFNPAASSTKVFQTIEYEGSNGWEVESYKSSFTEPNLGPQGSFTSTQDVTNNVYSYEEGLYTENGVTKRAGFDRKENLYVANLISNSIASPGEVRFGNSITGIKGYFATVKIKTDKTTQKGGIKELWATSTKYEMSTGY